MEWAIDLIQEQPGWLLGSLGTALLTFAAGLMRAGWRRVTAARPLTNQQRLFQSIMDKLDCVNDWTRDRDDILFPSMGAGSATIRINPSTSRKYQSIMVDSASAAEHLTSRQAKRVYASARLVLDQINSRAKARQLAEVLGKVNV